LDVGVGIIVGAGVRAMQWLDMVWIDLAQDEDQWKALVNMLQRAR
jgi:hypothetical protein